MEEKELWLNSIAKAYLAVNIRGIIGIISLQAEQALFIIRSAYNFTLKSLYCGSLK